METRQTPKTCHKLKDFQPLTLREGLDRERGLVAEFDFADVILANISVDLNDG